MTNQKKLLLGIVSFIPIIALALTLLAMFSIVFSLTKETAFYSTPTEVIISKLMMNMAGLIATIIILSLLSLGTLVYFLIHAINNKILSNDERLVWILVFIFVGMISFPIYWYMRIWKETVS